jgi:hypothetical protein
VKVFHETLPNRSGSVAVVAAIAVVVVVVVVEAEARAVAVNRRSILPIKLGTIGHSQDRFSVSNSLRRERMERWFLNLYWAPMTLTGHPLKVNMA